jgi:16S rRNA (adenine1518-N6/adenine1519-N6)-dimethyltransferase
MARQPLGQHFLTNEHWISRIREELGPPSPLPWIEIGAGRGEMTRELARDAARVIAIETDARFIPLLESNKIPNTEIVHGDVLQQDLAALAGGPFRVYGNLPYYITSPILHYLFANFAVAVREIFIVIQLEVAERIAANPCNRDYGYLSAFCQFFAHPEVLLRIPACAFQPPPKVESALLHLSPPGERDSLCISSADAAPFLEFIKLCFGQKRKTLRNNLKAKFGERQISAAISALNFAPSARAEELTLSQFANLYRDLSAARKSSPSAATSLSG